MTQYICDNISYTHIHRLKKIKSVRKTLDIIFEDNNENIDNKDNKDNKDDKDDKDEKNLYNHISTIKVNLFADYTNQIRKSKLNFRTVNILDTINEIDEYRKIKISYV